MLKEVNGENKALNMNPDALLVEATLVKPRENERLVRELRRKLAKQARVSDYKLKELKMKMTQVEMTTSLKEALEEKCQIVQKLALELRVRETQERTPNP